MSVARKGKKAVPVSLSKSFLHSGNTPLTEIKPSRLSLLPTLRGHKTNSSLDSFISEEEACNTQDYENYDLEYSTYLLRKLQNKLLNKNKEEKKENVKKCLIVLKWEFENLLSKHLKLDKDVRDYKMCFKVLRECNIRIELGRSVLNMLKENDFEVVLKSLTEVMDHSINQLQLVDIDRNIIDDMFTKNILGPESEIEECLKKVHIGAEKNKQQVASIAKELKEIEQLCLENTILKERYYSVLESISSELLETSYKAFTSVVKKAFKKRQELHDDGIISHSYRLFNMEDLLQPKMMYQVFNERPHTPQALKMESPYSGKPSSTSTPQPDEK